MRATWLEIWLSFVIVSILIAGTEAIRCYECNVWKAGYGHTCDNPRVRDGCLFCMKIFSETYMGYYKNTPRRSETTSRICARSPYQHFSHECWHYTSVSGHTTRCYCDTDLCNSATKRTISVLSLSGIIAAIMLARWH